MEKKDYSHLKGKPIEFISSYGHEFANCVLVEIGEEGLTIMGVLVAWADGKIDDEIGQDDKVFCLQTEFEEHRKLFPYVVEAIINGKLDGAKVREQAGLPISREGSSRLTCAFEGK